jgi:hypothetical protein
MVVNKFDIGSKPTAHTLKKYVLGQPFIKN